MSDDKFKAYIGDSVYVQYDGYHIVLTTENGYPDDPRNLICLEPEVYEALLQWVEALKLRIKEFHG
jgi:hypothetical protein